MNLILAVLALIITIMQLPNDRVSFIVKLILTSFIASFIYRWWFGGFTLWFSDSMWTQENINRYIKTNLPKAICCFSFVWAIYYFAFVKLFKNAITKSAIRISKRPDYNSMVPKIIKSAMGFPGKIGAALRINKKEPVTNYDELVSKIARDICFILEVLTVWILQFGSSVLFIVVFVIVSGFSILIIFFNPISKKAFKEIEEFGNSRKGK
jgi:hypothetical protein